MKLFIFEKGEAMETGIGERIRKRRREKGLTLKDVAGDMVTPAQISAVERGKCRPSQNLLKYIAERLECDVEEIALSDEEQCVINFEKIKDKSQKLFNQKKYSDAVEIIDSASGMLDFINDNQKGFYYFIKGECTYIQENYNDSFEFYTKSVTYYSRYGDRNVVCDIYKKIGNCLYNTKKYDMALGYYINAWNYVNESVDEEIAASILYDISICNTTLERYEDGEEYMKKCKEYCETHEYNGKEKISAGIEMIKGIIDKESKKNKEGLKLFDDAFKKYFDEKNYIGMGRAKNNAGLCFCEMGEKEKAVKVFKEAIEYKIMCDDKTIGDTYINLSELYLEMGNLNEAIETIEKAEEYVLKQNDTDSIIEIFIKKFEYLLESKDYNRAEIVGLLALDFVQKSRNKDYEARIYIKFSEMYKKLGDEKMAMEYLFKTNAVLK